MRFSHAALLLTLITGTASALLAADKPRPVPPAELDQPLERIQNALVVIPEALKTTGTDDTVTMTAVISPDGTIAQVEGVQSSTPEGAAAATAAVKKWRFARPFVKGAPVSVALPVAVAIRPGQATEDSADTGATVGAFGGKVLNGPEPRLEFIPEYPAALRESPVNGYAVVTALIDARGQAGDVVIEFASRAEFAGPAAAILPSWVFKPASSGGEPAAMRASLRVEFRAESAPWTPEERDLQSRLRYLRDYDEGPREKTSKPLVYPYEALMADKGGGITLNVVIGPDGRAAHITPGPGGDPDYLHAARASLATWEFFPAMRANQPVFGQIRMQLSFDPRRDEFEFDDTTLALIEGLKDGTATIFTLKQVDQLPKPTRQVSPRFPQDHEGPRTGEAMIECIIDAQGRPQLPRVIRASTPEFGWIAATAVAQWRFEPARKGGEPVMTRARLPFRVSPEVPAAAATPAAP